MANLIRKWINYNPKKTKNQLDDWFKREKCIALMNRWGTYESFEQHPNLKDKKIIIETLKEIVNELGYDSSVLDVGCGTGHFSWIIKDKVRELIGLDISKHMLDLIKKQFKNQNIDLKTIIGSCWEIPLEDNSVDFSFQVDVCMHIGGSMDAIKEMIRVSKKIIMFTGPSFENFNDKTDKRIGNKSWAISIPLLQTELNKMIDNGYIKDYKFIDRDSSKTYNHKLLVIKK